LWVNNPGHISSLGVPSNLFDPEIEFRKFLKPLALVKHEYAELKILKPSLEYLINLLNFAIPRKERFLEVHLSCKLKENVVVVRDVLRKFYIEEGNKYNCH
jgi:hypothetical protein